MSAEFLRIPGECGTEQIVCSPTRGDNILDLAFCSNPSLIKRCKVIPGVGDHDTVLIDTLLRPTRSKPTRRKIYLWDKANISQLRQDTINFVDSFISRDYNSIDSCWSHFKEQTSKLVDQHVPHKLTRARLTNPWINTSTRRLSRRKLRAHRKAKSTNRQRDIQRYLSLKSECQRNIREAHNQYMENIISPCVTSNPKKFWSFIKGKKQEASGVAPLRNTDGLINSDPQSKANILNIQFQSVFTREDTSSAPDKGPSPFPSLDRIRITPKGIQKLLGNLQPHKATGPDYISARFLKDLAKELAPALTFMFQLSLDSGAVPLDWKMAHVVPIFKKGDKSDAANYRPVSLTAICSKVMEHILHSNIMDHLEENSILTPAQHGFRSKRSCETQLIATIQDLARGLSDGCQTDVVLLDFAKAFDKVPHQRLLYKLHYYGVRGCTLEWIRSFLSNRKQCVLVEGSMSDEAEVVSGVPQGTVMGPLLFLVYINDLPEVTTSNVKLFADDCLIYRPIKSSRDTEQLQHDLQSLEKWESDWQMAFHPAKCTVIHVSKKRRPIKAQYQLHGHILEAVPSGKYLGISISEDLSWHDHINTTTAKATRSVGFLRRNLSNCPTPVKSQAYTVLVRPVLEYASVVWDPYQQHLIQQLESVQRHAARFATGNYRSRDPGCVTAMIDHLGWEPLQHRRARNKVIMFYKIYHHIVEVPVHHLFHNTREGTRASTANNIRQISTRVDTYKYSFIPSTIVAWNNIPPAIRNTPTVDSFRHALSSISVSEYLQH
ncbi:hypothetical protein FSP39_008956 [Pinctada imbricata]|uniref:Reverse transcriptase domain-containing protein n=1 Tax=Pinctada imbricata TaxID=66713 RepID=A0AA88YH31_PINIB|nr:hypothetical protein FSP39_008956 [Pinctada imbricata]